MNSLRNIKIVLKNSIMSAHVLQQIKHSNKNLINMDTTESEGEKLNENFTDILDDNTKSIQINKTRKVKQKRK